MFFVALNMGWIYFIKLFPFEFNSIVDTFHKKISFTTPCNREGFLKKRPCKGLKNSKFLFKNVLDFIYKKIVHKFN